MILGLGKADVRLRGEGGSGPSGGGGGSLGLTLHQSLQLQELLSSNTRQVMISQHPLVAMISEPSVLLNSGPRVTP